MPDARAIAPGWSAGVCRALLFFLGLASLSHCALAQTKNIQFAIAAQPLAPALEAYSLAAGRELYYDGQLAVDRRSSAIEGLLPPETALRQLLVGTGLVAQPTGVNSYSIVPARPALRANEVFLSYFAIVEKQVAQLLCTRSETRPGVSDMVLELWITERGTVRRTRLLDPANDLAHASAFAVALRDVQIAAAPPADLPQPIVMAILSRAEGQSTGCANSSSAAGR